MFREAKTAHLILTTFASVHHLVVCNNEASPICLILSSRIKRVLTSVSAGSHIDRTQTCQTKMSIIAFGWMTKQLTVLCEQTVCRFRRAAWAHYWDERAFMGVSPVLQSSCNVVKLSPMKDQSMAIYMAWLLLSRSIIYLPKMIATYSCLFYVKSYGTWSYIMARHRSGWSRHIRTPR